jgi:predicted secreted protein
MSENYKDILSNLNTEVDQELLLQYLQGKLSEEQKHEVEKQLAQGDFEDDALEGLQEFKDVAQLQYMAEMLNRDLKKKTTKKKNRREKMKIKDQPWLWVSILILFLLVALCYIVIRRLSGP